MNCPRTGKPLVETEIDGFKFSISKATGGIWLENFQLELLCKFSDVLKKRLISRMLEYYSDELDTSSMLQSPAAFGVCLLRRPVRPNSALTVDQCPQSGGIWVDARSQSELAALFQLGNEADIVVSKGSGLDPKEREYMEAIMAMATGSKAVNKHLKIAKRSWVLPPIGIVLLMIPFLQFFGMIFWLSGFTCLTKTYYAVIIGEGDGLLNHLIVGTIVNIPAIILASSLIMTVFVQVK